MIYRRALALALLLAPAPVWAQGLMQPVGVSDADALADTMRRLGANPLDLDALLTAGELSVRLEDLSAAGAFFARAEKIDSRNGRAKAGEAAILVRSERPAEALRYFAMAEQFGLSPARFASDRGLAYDLLGDPGRAQRDYRLALAARDDAESRRRYALSLGIAGRQAQALDELAPLIRQNDRAAWRTRAFVLAMGGDAAEASRIAQTMMPPGAAAGLRSFFAELPRLPAVDRAFAVHFGEVRATPTRLADARLAAAQAPLALEAAPVQVATGVTSPPPDRKGKRDRKRDRKSVEIAAVALPPATPPLPQPPAYQAPAYFPAIAATTPVRDRPLSTGELASLSAAGNRVRPGRSPARSLPPIPTFTPPPLTPAEQASLAAAILPSARGRRAPVTLAAAPRAATFVRATPFSPPVTLAAATPLTVPAARPAANLPPLIADATPILLSERGARPTVARSTPSAANIAPVLAVATPVSAPAAPAPGFSTAPLAGTVPVQPAPAPISPGTPPVRIAMSTSVPAPGFSTTGAPALSSAQPSPAPVASASSTSPSPAVASPAVALATSLPTPTGTPAPILASAAPISAPPVSASLAPLASRSVAAAATSPAGPPVELANADVSTIPSVAAALPEAAGATAISPPQAIASAAASVVATPIPQATSIVAPALTIPIASLIPTETVATAPASTPLAPLVTPAVAPVVATATPVPRPAASRRDADSVLARIISGLSIPAAELGVAAPSRAVAGETAPATDRRAAERKAAADKAIADRKAGADKKALADKKAAAEKKALADKEATEEKAVRADPPRIWVQVAGGANDGDLVRAWRAASDKAPAAFAGRQGYTAPLRATNRVLAGPFKTDAEARAYVNQLAKAGVSAFTFTSDAGQKISKLGGK